MATYDERLQAIYHAINDGIDGLSHEDAMCLLESTAAYADSLHEEMEEKMEDGE